MLIFYRATGIMVINSFTLAPDVNNLTYIYLLGINNNEA